MTTFSGTELSMSEKQQLNISNTTMHAIDIYRRPPVICTHDQDMIYIEYIQAATSTTSKHVVTGTQRSAPAGNSS